MELHKPDVGHLKVKKLHVSPYVDKQIRHLVVEEYFDFEAISDLMSNGLSYGRAYVSGA